jgi:acyl dehydratase
LPIDYPKLRNWTSHEVMHRFTERDTILYALAVGLGVPPTDKRQLGFVYELGLSALPSMATVLADPGLWVRIPELAIDWKRALIGDQAVVVHHRLPTAGEVKATTRVVGILDKGDRGAFILTERDIYDCASGALLATVKSTVIGRSEGGFGGSSDTAPPAYKVPSRLPDRTRSIQISPRAALLYRLTGDLNPIHIDPDVAAEAGYHAPILHGLCTFGMAGYALVDECCDGNPDRVHTLQVRFTAPVFPGDRLSLEIWKESDRAHFRAHVPDRNAMVLDCGLLTVREN